MAHGTRGRWLRVAATGFGVMLCTGLVGCLHDDKPKDTKVGANKQLPNTPQLPPGAGSLTKAGQQAQPGQPGYVTPGYPPPGGPNIQQTGGFQPAGNGLGAGAGQFRTNGLNTNPGTVPQQNVGGPSMTPGAGATGLGTPGIPGAYAPPAGGPAPSQYGGITAPGGGSASPPPPDLLNTPLPPPPPMHGGSDFGSGAGTGPVVPPSAYPVAPSPPSATGKGPPLYPNYPN
jgi:hypothetical protein